MMTNVIPLWFFKVYWLCWFLLSLAAVVLDSGYLVVPLVIAFLAVETLGILFTVKNEGTLTDTTAKYVPEDLTFIFMGAMFWRLSQWAPDWKWFGHQDWTWVVWVLAAWLLQHFIVHYQQKVKTGWDLPRKVRLWF